MQVQWVTMITFNKLSNSGYKVTDVLPDFLIEEINNYKKTVKPTQVQPWHLGGHRSAWFLTDPENSIRKHIEQQVKIEIENAIGKKIELRGFEIWEDTAGYENAWHHDDPNNVRNILIVYLGNDNRGMGTVFKEDDIEYVLPYSHNTGLLLLNSDVIQHAMDKCVPIDTIRKTFYINFNVVL